MAGIKWGASGGAFPPPQPARQLGPAHAEVPAGEQHRVLRVGEADCAGGGVERRRGRGADRAGLTQTKSMGAWGSEISRSIVFQKQAKQGNPWH